ncbi:sigma-70 family RNA polymerase sigma factor [Zhouia spongiae]|uniref:Sigma-70 family RNA polymerase sigma factor n=1 Tax=Zhouia spongiae TaxID=2202721 RepID=A0ABY3YNP9_9FLAO|nr:sigma-70 family RNA polymerase sigma factor [Zhouia spongiae]UNY99308.1 sigma-70 family RNA polymerase sigma factor [Zhouia spongiae]
MSEKEIHEDQKYINGLLQNNTFVVQMIYDKFAPKVVNFIKNNSGDTDQAKDVIQETLITIYNQASEKGLQLTCPFEAYFFLLCKRKWINHLKKESNKEVTIKDEILSNNETTEHMLTETSLYEEKHALFTEMFLKLGQACKELLKATFKIKSMEEVAESLGVTYAYARKKKSLCIGKLTKLVQESPGYKNLKL